MATKASKLLSRQIAEHGLFAAEDYAAEVDRAARAKELFMRLRLGDDVPPPAPYRKLPKTQKPKLGPTHLVIGDSHARPSDSNRRYEWLGRMVADLQPDTVIDIGDWFSMDSLCRYDVGMRSFEGKRYWKDIEAGVDAQQRFQAQCGGFRPRLVRVLGNHEHRIARAIELDSRLPGVIGLDDLLSSRFRWEEHPFLHPVTIDGITYSHYPDKGGRGPGASSKHLAANALAQQHRSVVWGHTHRFDYFEEPRGQGKIMSINCGAFLDKISDMQEAYAQNDVWRWKRGILVIEDVRDGIGDPVWWSMDRIKARWG